MKLNYKQPLPTAPWSKGEYDAGLEPLSDHLEAQALWQQAYETKVDAHFQLYLSYVKYLKAAGQL